MTDVWTKWESQVVNGVFPLRRFLGNSDHSVVFLTEHKALKITDAAIKIVPADPVLADAQLSQWRMAATLSHPHLVRLLETGRCQLGGHPFLFVVMEYADQTLAQVLPRRPLTPEEVREIVHPTLEALSFLHRKQLVQGQLKPPNFLVVNDQLKLASDTVRPVGEARASIAKPSAYDAPEVREGRISTAGDMWGLGVTIVEALTQRPPAGSDERSPTVSLPTTLAPEFVEVLRRCLSRNPAGRPEIPDIAAAIAPAPQASSGPVARAVVRQAPGGGGVVRVLKSAAARPYVVPAVAVGLLALVAAWTGSRMLRGQPSSREPAASISATPQPPPPAPPAEAQNSKTSAPAPNAVLHQEIPEVPRSARDSIRGRIKVTVRVSVDRTGNVVGETLQNPGSSKYFARLATDAARKWKFAPADNGAARVWLLHFEFTRGGTTGRATSVRS